MEQNSSSLDRISNWFSRSLSIKLFIIFILAMLLMIPVHMVESVIYERASYQREANDSVTSSWSGPQTITGPILSVPLHYEYPVSTQKDNKTTTEYRSITKHLHILPETLNVSGQVTPLILNRGIYESIVFDAESSLSGNFKMSEDFDKNHLVQIDWPNAFITVGISDLRGIQDQISFQLDDKSIDASAGSKIPDLISSGLTIPLHIDSSDVEDQMKFSMNLSMHGSGSLNVSPLGKTTSVNVKSDWSDPKFIGAFLPDNREITQDGFTADWKVLELNRNYPQQFIGTTSSNKIQQSQFGVEFILPVDNYQKSTRSVKYALLSIGFTFLIFFLVEVLNDRKIHSFQYGMVGFTLCLFYLLLVSLTEHMAFDYAYLISAISIITMITGYAQAVFKNSRFTLILLAALIAIYGFVFITIQMVEYALVIGSIGLTIMMAITLYGTRNIDWYNLKKQP